MNLPTAAVRHWDTLEHRNALSENFSGLHSRDKSRMTLKCPKIPQAVTHACALLPPRFHCNPELTGKTLSRLKLLYAPSSPWLVRVWERSCYSQRSSMEDTHSCPSSPQITTWSVIITFSSNPLLWGDFLILETASSSYHWSLLTLHQQRSQFHRSTSQSSRPQLQNCPCL